MGKVLVRLLINAASIAAASYLVDGVTLDMSRLLPVLGVALVFGIVNALIRPVLRFVSFPFILVTFGLFALVINAGMLELTAWLTDALRVDGFWAALWGSVVISLVGWVLELFFGPDEDEDD